MIGLIKIILHNPLIYEQHKGICCIPMVVTRQNSQYATFGLVSMAIRNSPFKFGVVYMNLETTICTPKAPKKIVAADSIVNIKI